MSIETESIPSKRPMVLLGITGSVATVKIPELCVKLHPYADIQLIATESSLHFMKIAQEYNPQFYEKFLELQLPLYTDKDEWDDYKEVKTDPVLHIELQKKSDVFAIVPLSANTLAKMTTGICDNLLTSTYRAWNPLKPIIVAPCMNTNMYNHPLTETQLHQLQEWGVAVIEPVVKLLACGDFGKGALPPVDDVVKQITALL